MNIEGQLGEQLHRLAPRVFRIDRQSAVEQGQRIGTISGPGGDGYMSMAHIDITVWRLSGRGHESVPFIGPNAIGGREFLDSGGANQHMGATVTP